jgi:hypothetical protein
MSNESRQQLAELQTFVQHNVEQMNRAALGMIEVMRNAADAFAASSNPANTFVLGLVRKSLDVTEANVAALCDHAQSLARANSPADCVKLQMELVRSSIASMQKQTMGMMGAGGESVP